MLTSDSLSVHIAIDRGGTFTDVYARRGDRVYTEKLLSSDPANYADAASEGIRRILERITGRTITPGAIETDGIGWVRMGTTVATNALLERAGAPTALAITRGFADLLTIGYQNRPDLFALNIQRPDPIHRRVIEINERIRPYRPGDENRFPLLSGTGGERYAILETPDPDVIRTALLDVLASGCRSLAVVLMHGYSCPDHEKLVGEIGHQLGFDHISLSHQVMPRIRINGRGDTTCVDAYLTPHIRAYLDDFSAAFHGNPADPFPLYFMQSDGGLVEAHGFRGSNAILSGPAGGVVGYAETTRAVLGDRPIIGFDMGGTSTDVSRFDSGYELVHETETGGVRIQAPQLAIRTVAAGGGSRLFYRDSLFVVGPESAGAHPGPVCYRKNGFLAVTDANLLLGRLQPDFFPEIFGPDENQPLDLEAVRREFERLTRMINQDLRQQGRPLLTAEEVALGFIEVANEAMVRPIREISVMRGFDIRTHVLACFGGAGGQHAVAIARKLGIRTIFIHRQSGILSALGISMADVVIDRQQPAASAPLDRCGPRILERLTALSREVTDELRSRGYNSDAITCHSYLNLRYEGTDTSFMVARPEDDDFGRAFRERHEREFGFILENRDLLVDDIRVRATAALPRPEDRRDIGTTPGTPRACRPCRFACGMLETPVFLLDDLGQNQEIQGPALIIAPFSTIVVEPASRAQITREGDIIIHLEDTPPARITTRSDPIHLAVFGNRFMSIAEQMGRILQKTALSTNIKERLDFSCAVFDRSGGLVANAPHVPVHLGAMGEAVREQIRLRPDLRPGDVLLSNHPAAGGSHLPDITVITPVWSSDAIRFFVASRGHHADVGGISPGSMPPFSASLDEEGVHIRSFKIIDQVVFREKALRSLLCDRTRYPVRDPDTVIADLKAQVAANQQGIGLLHGLISEYSEEVVLAYMGHIQENGELAVRAMLKKMAARFAPKEKTARLQARDRLDDGGTIGLTITIDRETGDACFDFSATGPEMRGNLNAPPAVTRSAILYCLRCLIGRDIPLNQGCMNPIRVILPENCLLNPSDHAAVAGGNVLTSQRVVDVIFRAFRAAAASQGCMNNLTFGSEKFGYYETIGGGSGAGPGWHGCSGVHTHMTNTRITDPEILEQRYPVLLREFAIRRGSGGSGKFRGGDGLVRDIEFLEPLNVTILSERRVRAPYGMAGGRNGKAGRNIRITANGAEKDLGGKAEFTAQPGERIRILTPGGGAWGQKGA